MSFRAVMEDSNDEKITKAADLLEEASQLLRSKVAQRGAAAPLPRGRPRSPLRLNSRDSDGRPTTSRPDRHTIQTTLDQARSMVRQSSAAGLFRRLNRNERLRAASASPSGLGRGGRRGRTHAQERKSKPFPFARLKCFREDGVEELEDCDTLKSDSIIANGMLVVYEGDGESSIRKAITEALVGTFPLLGEKDFEFVKVRQKKVSPAQLGPGAEFNYHALKKIAGQGQTYVKIKEGYEHIYRKYDSIIISDPDDDDKELLKPTFGEDAVPSSIRPIAQLAQQKEEDTTDKIEEVICEIKGKSLMDPVEILRLLQNRLLKGRQLDVIELTDGLDGQTNYICVDRQKILSTTFDEFKTIEDFRLTFEVDFMGELAKDSGGPRKEWIRLMNARIKEKYFENGLREMLESDYYHVGIMVGIALLQNGQLPRFMPNDVIEKLVVFPNENGCVRQLQDGLNKFHLVQILKEFPVMLHLLRPAGNQLNVKVLLKAMEPQFSPEVSTALAREKKIYALFIKYVREVASGRRHPLTLGDILAFATGASEEPPRGADPGVNLTGAKGMWRQSRHRAGVAGAKPPKGRGSGGGAPGKFSGVHAL